MTLHDITGAAERLQSISVDGYAAGRNRPGMCLRWSYFAVGIRPNLTPANLAVDAWNNAPAEHRHPIGPTTVVPKDVPIILGPSPTRTDANRGAGDVFPAAATGVGLSTPGVMTDSPLRGAGYIGGGTIAERATQTRRPVLGYLTHWLGYDITTAAMRTAPAPSVDKLQEHEMTKMRLMTNITVNDANYKQDVLFCVETGFWWETSSPAYTTLAKSRYGITEVEQLPASEWNFWRSMTLGHRAAVGAAAAASVWSFPMAAGNGKHSAQERLVGADTKAGAADLELSDAQVTQLASRIKFPQLTITGKAIAA